MYHNHAVNLQRQIMHQTNYVVKISCFHGRNDRQYGIKIDDLIDFRYYSTYMVRFRFKNKPIDVKLNANSTDRNGFPRKGFRDAKLP